MKTTWFIAKRYFFSRKKKNFIQFISWLSILGIAFSTTALIIILSIFNGLEKLLESLYSSFDPEIKIEARKGKSFPVNEAFIARINTIEGVKIVTEIIEDYVYLRYRNAEIAVIVKGVGDNFIAQERLDNTIVRGELKLKEKDLRYAVIGQGIQQTLSIDINDMMQPLEVFYVKSLKATSLVTGSKIYSKKLIHPGGVFAIEKKYDTKYVIMPLDFVQELSGYDNKRTSLEVKVSSGWDIQAVQQNLKKTLGESFVVLNSKEQQKDLYRLLKIEKLFSFLSLSLLILISSINSFFMLMMLILEKKRDISILVALGANSSFICRLFMMEGIIVSFLGAGIGLFLGGLLCWLQEHVGLVSMGIQNALVKYYPVKMMASDFVAIGSVVIVITLIISFYPAHIATKSYSARHL